MQAQTQQQSRSQAAPQLPPNCQSINVPAPAFTPGPGLRFVLLIEATVVAGPLWADARQVYIEPLLRDMERGRMGRMEYAVVLYRTRDSAYAGAMVESSGWLASVPEVGYARPPFRTHTCGHARTHTRTQEVRDPSAGRRKRDRTRGVRAMVCAELRAAVRAARAVRRCVRCWTVFSSWVGVCATRV